MEEEEEDEEDTEIESDDKVDVSTMEPSGASCLASIERRSFSSTIRDSEESLSTVNPSLSLFCKIDSLALLACDLASSAIDLESMS